jgi:hypothetical protein
MTYRTPPTSAKSHLRLRVSSPCFEDWDGMTGDHLVRHCTRCDREVFNMSALTIVEATGLLARHGASMCARFYERSDGTVMTRDCPVAAPTMRNPIAIAAAVGISAALAIAAFADDAPTRRPPGAAPHAPVAPTEAYPLLFLPPPAPLRMGAISVLEPGRDGDRRWAGTAASDERAETVGQRPTA